MSTLGQLKVVGFLVVGPWQTSMYLLVHALSCKLKVESPDGLMIAQFSVLFGVTHSKALLSRVALISGKHQEKVPGAVLNAESQIFLYSCQADIFYLFLG